MTRTKVKTASLLLDTGNTIIGAATSTGTASQPLQVTGGAYVSGNIGLGTTNPTTKLHVTGGDLTVGTGVTISSTGINAPGIGLTIASINSGPLAGFRNAIINGDMRIWQRGTSGFTSGYTVDRWYLNGANAASRSTDVPSGFQYSLSFSIASGTTCGASQRIESVNATELASQSVTVSFWFKRTGAAGNLQVNLDYPTAVDDYTGTGAIGATQVAASPSTSWTYYSVTFPSINANAANGLMVTVFSTSGSNASLGGLLTGIQLEVGPVATPFERRPIGTELALCQRYFWNHTPSAISHTSSEYAGTGTSYINIPFGLTMRATPTIAYNNFAGTAISGIAPNRQSVRFSAAGGFYLDSSSILQASAEL